MKKKTRKYLRKTFEFFSCMILYVFTLCSFLSYLNSTNILKSLLDIAAVTLFFYSTITEFMYFLDLLKEEKKWKII